MHILIYLSNMSCGNYTSYRTPLVKCVVTCISEHVKQSSKFPKAKDLS